MTVPVFTPNFPRNATKQPRPLTFFRNKLDNLQIFYYDTWLIPPTDKKLDIFTLIHSS